MPARFNPPRGLSPAALALPEPDLADKVILAENLLGLADLPETADGDERAFLAVGEQVNYLLALGPDGLAKGSEARGEQSVAYARNPQTGRAYAISPTAAALAAVVIAAHTPAPAPDAASAVISQPFSGSVRGQFLW